MAGCTDAAAFHASINDWHALMRAIELGGKRSARVAVAELGQAQASVDIQARRSQVRSHALRSTASRST
mgnify:CR=1 FL=1